MTERAENQKPMHIDSAMSREQAIAQNPDMPCPRHIIERQELVGIDYLGFDRRLHRGQIVIDRELAPDIIELFALMLDRKFPIKSVIPIGDSRFRWDDERSVAANNTSAFNYRLIAGTDKISNHGYGRAIDINPAVNPYFADGWTSPPWGVYDPAVPGTIVDGDFIVTFLLQRGWKWGGHWEKVKDYQHFEKPLHNE